jgi:thiopurine S-methyltransferase
MQAEFWHERWRTGQIGFHQTTVDASLRRLWPRLNLGKGRRVFVPLSGKSLDLIWLRDQGYAVVGVELSAAAIEAFLMENGVPARRRVQGNLEIYESPDLTLFRGDYYELTPAHLGEVAAVYDRAALISWTPKLRDAYVEHMAKLLSAGTQMLLITLEYPQSQMSGPPFSVDADEVHRLYRPSFEIQQISRRDILASEPGLRERGVRELTEVCHHLTRT